MAQENFGVKVQVCENGCKGMWFDQGELSQLDANNEGAGAALEAALRSPRRNEGKRGPINCPKCGIPMHTHKYKRDQEVNVDECYQCGGFFLDSGELTEIRNHRLSDAEIQAYSDKLANALPEYKNELKEMEREKKRLAAIQRWTKFLTHQYWFKTF
jgi:hypothetical protein